MTLRIFLIVLIVVIALGIGLILRRLLVHRLKRTILDNWLVQTIGVILIFPPLILAALAAPVIWDSGLIVQVWEFIKLQLRIGNGTVFVWNCIETILIIALGLGFARTIMKVTVRRLGENRIDINIRTLLGRIFYITIVLITLFWLLNIWNIAIALPVAVIGTLTVAFTFAIQDILKDLVAGFYILMERPFHIGDQITIGDQSNTANHSHTGKVEDIQLRATKLRIVSGEEVAVPNALVFGSIVVNNSLYSERRAAITITLSQEEYTREETPKQILQALQEIDTVMVKPEPTVLLNSYTGNMLTLIVRFWVANGQLATVSEVMYTLRTVLPHADMTVLESAGNV